MSKSNRDNFDPKEEIQRLRDDLGSTLNQPDKFAEVFVKAAKSQKIIDEALQIVILNLIEKDQLTRDHIKRLAKEQGLESWAVITKKSLAVYGLLSC